MILLPFRFSFTNFSSRFRDLLARVRGSRTRPESGQASNGVGKTREPKLREGLDTTTILAEVWLKSESATQPADWGLLYESRVAGIEDFCRLPHSRPPPLFLILSPKFIAFLPVQPRPTSQLFFPPSSPSSSSSSYPVTFRPLGTTTAFTARTR